MPPGAFSVLYFPHYIFGRVCRIHRVVKLLLTLTLLFVFAAVPVLRAADEVEPPVPVRTVVPEYPDELKRQGVSGVVTISFLVDEHGVVSEAKVIKTTNEAFSKPAMDALVQWKFKPAMKGGTPVSKKVAFPIQFRADS